MKEAKEGEEEEEKEEDEVKKRMKIWMGGRCGRGV